MQYIFVVSLVSIFALSALFVKSQVVPHNVAGRVFTNSSNGVQNGIPVLINDTISEDTVMTAVNAPPIPQLRGSYSATISGSDGDLILVKAWNTTHYGETRTNLVSGTTNVDVILNISRDSEANVTILIPLNNTLKNKTAPFNITANVTMLGNDGIECNASLTLTDYSIVNTTNINNFTQVLGTIPLGTHRVVNWSVQGINPGSTNFSVAVYCASDGKNFYRLNNASGSNLTIQNLAPEITELFIEDPLDLNAGQNTTMYCNATIFEANSIDDIVAVNATIFQQSIGHSAVDDNNNHYTNSSCVNVSTSGVDYTFSCGFSVSYYANNGTWACNVSVTDFSNASVANETTFVINELLAIDITPSEIDYGELSIAQTSPDDVNVTIANRGNVPFNITVEGFGIEDGDNLSMVCSKGNISISNERYAVNPSTSFNLMTNLTSNATMIENITFPQRTNDNVQEQDTNTTYWKILIPPLISGACNGSVQFGTIVI